MSLTKDTVRRRYWKRVYRVMEREMLCSEHAAMCFIEAQRRERTLERARGGLRSTPPDEYRVKSTNRSPATTREKESN